MPTAHPIIIPMPISILIPTPITNTIPTPMPISTITLILIQKFPPIHHSTHSHHTKKMSNSIHIVTSNYGPSLHSDPHLISKLNHNPDLDLFLSSEFSSLATYQSTFQSTSNVLILLQTLLDIPIISSSSSYYLSSFFHIN